MNELKNLVSNTDLVEKKSVSAIIASNGSTISILHAQRINGAGIKFAIISSASLVSIFVSKIDYDKALIAISDTNVYRHT